MWATMERMSFGLPRDEDCFEQLDVREVDAELIVLAKRVAKL